MPLVTVVETLIQFVKLNEPCTMYLFPGIESHDTVTVWSFDWNYLSDFHQQAPEQILGALGPPRTKDGKTLTDEEKN